ncbi:hypothetical protein JYT29_01540 [Nitrospina gracilis]|nr:hypothetical protein [Nitrospina gracilis]
MPLISGKPLHNPLILREPQDDDSRKPQIGHAELVEASRLFVFMTYAKVSSAGAR